MGMSDVKMKKISIKHEYFVGYDVPFQWHEISYFRRPFWKRDTPPPDSRNFPPYRKLGVGSFIGFLRNSLQFVCSSRVNTPPTPIGNSKCVMDWDWVFAKPKAISGFIYVFRGIGFGKNMDSPTGMRYFQGRDSCRLDPPLRSKNKNTLFIVLYRFWKVVLFLLDDTNATFIFRFWKDGWFIWLFFVRNPFVTVRPPQKMFY